MGVSYTQKSLKDWHRLWWVNPRHNGSRSMRLTERGLEDFETKADLKSYKIDFPDTVDSFPNQLILRLDQFVNGPYYITTKYIKVFTEKTAVELVLFSGDINKFGWAKAKSQKNNEKTN